MSEKYPLTLVSAARLLLESAWRRNDAAEDNYPTDFHAARALLAWAYEQLRIAERIEGVERKAADQ